MAAWEEGEDLPGDGEREEWWEWEVERETGAVAFAEWVAA
jgi:hypothetical protein